VYKCDEHLCNYVILCAIREWLVYILSSQGGEFFLREVKLFFGIFFLIILPRGSLNIFIINAINSLKQCFATRWFNFFIFFSFSVKRANPALKYWSLPNVILCAIVWYYLSVIKVGIFPLTLFGRLKFVFSLDLSSGWSQGLFPGILLSCEQKKSTCRVLFRRLIFFAVQGQAFSLPYLRAIAWYIIHNW